MQNSFWAIIGAVLLYGVIHSVLAALGFKQWVRRRLGDNAYRRYYRLFFSVQAGVLFLPVLALAALLPDQVIYRIPMPWMVLTILLQVTAVVLLVHSVMLTGALRFIGLAQAADHAQAEKPLPLVVRGMYRWVRHPLYTLTFVFIWLVPQMSWNTLALNIGVTFYTLAGAMLEERKLLHEFGESYAHYRAHTPFLIPGLILKKKQIDKNA
jgi:protein-S-isoprenylcysteine O-methyltransferase Ste14